VSIWWAFAVSAPFFLAILLPLRAHAQSITYSEFKFGVWNHDTKALSGREKGVDLNPEFMLWSPITDDMVADTPDWLRWALQPRPTLGGAFNTAGLTNQYYLGPTWAWFLARDLINPDDGIVLGYFFGPGFNDGQLHNGNAARKALGSHVLFREALDLGYQIDLNWEISAYIDHISNGGLAKENQSINDLGIRIGYRF
jgi:hypothetical protein